jgi:hypothetical protein
VFLQGASATFSASVFSDNAMFGSAADESAGGAVIEARAGLLSPSLVRLQGCQFFNNTAPHATLLADNRGRVVQELASGAGSPLAF